MVTHDLIRDVEAKPRAPRGSGRRETLELLEEPAALGRWDPGAMVADADDAAPAVRGEADLHLDRRARGRVLRRVGQQVAHDLADPVLVGQDVEGYVRCFDRERMLA